MKIIIKMIVILLLIRTTFNAQPLQNRTYWEKYFKESITKLDPIEGIWSTSNVGKLYDHNDCLLKTVAHPQIQTIVIFKKGGKYATKSIGSDDGVTSKGKTLFVKTAIDRIYLMQHTFDTSNITVKGDAILIDNGLLKFSRSMPAGELKYQLGDSYVNGLYAIFEESWIKISPKSADYEILQPSSGTGFAITIDGIIATNFHVVKGAKAIKVRGINGDFDNALNAKLIAEDKNNDLAIIKIDDLNFTTLKALSYTISKKTAQVGSPVFVLGYPLRATMGDEIKLTNGIISSKSGFQGDVTTYQISAPIQPGNSGGPLFDENGNVVGVINAKHSGAENVSYAIKISYLTNLIDILSTKPKLPVTSKLVGKELSEQVKFAKEFVYIIEVN